MDPSDRAGRRRTGDAAPIPGDYQLRAADSPNRVQRFWHYSKKTAIAALCPPSAGDRVLDIGCGSGVVSDYLATAFGARVTAIDGNRDAVAFARSHFPSVEFLDGLVDEGFLPGREFDAIYCLEVIEHVYEEQVQALLLNAHRLLRPGGRILVTTPNYRSLWPLIERAMDALRVAPTLAGEQHVTFFRAATLRDALRHAGFTVDAVRTNCQFAPWVAPVSWRLALKVDAWERGIRWPLGSILVAVATKPTTTPGG